MPTTIKNEFVYLPKSTIKAGEGIKDGLYPFFTSSDTQVLSRNAYEFDGEIVILGTGGKASCNYVNGKFSYSTDNYALKSKGSIIPRFLYYYLRHNNLQILDNGFHGAGLKHISKEYISNIELPVLSLDNQKRIVLYFDIIDSSLKKEKELLFKYDELIKSRFSNQIGGII